MAFEEMANLLSGVPGEKSLGATQVWRQSRDLNPGHIDGRWVLHYATLAP